MKTIITFFKRRYYYHIVRHIRYYKRGRELDGKIGVALEEAYLAAICDTFGKAMAKRINKEVLDRTLSTLVETHDK